MSAGLWGFRPRADRGVLARPGGERTVPERSGETKGVSLRVGEWEGGGDGGEVPISEGILGRGGHKREIEE